MAVRQIPVSLVLMGYAFSNITPRSCVSGGRRRNKSLSPCLHAVLPARLLAGFLTALALGEHPQFIFECMYLSVCFKNSFTTVSMNWVQGKGGSVCAWIAIFKLL